MNNKKIEQLIASFKNFKTQVTKDEHKSKEFLQRAGILTPKGKFTKHYKHLCTQPEQA